MFRGWNFDDNDHFPLPEEVLRNIVQCGSGRFLFSWLLLTFWA